MSDHIETPLLVDRIREKCWKESWFGPELLGPKWSSTSPNDLRTRHFAFPPTTQAHIRTSQALLGFDFPPLLVMLYTELANGGFGPGTGIRGTVEGYQWNEQTAVQAYQGSSTTYLVDLKDQWVRWPKFLLPLCDMGDVIEVCVDCQLGHVVTVAPTDHQRGIVPVMSMEAPSLEVWLDRWIRGSEGAV